jgi:hypothetical protein
VANDKTCRLRAADDSCLGAGFASGVTVRFPNNSTTRNWVILCAVATYVQTKGSRLREAVEWPGS